MLESYFVKPQTVDRIRGSWIGPEIEHYVDWLGEQGYAARCVFRRVPLLVAFGEFARARGALAVEDLPAHVEAFVAARVASSRSARRGGEGGRRFAGEIRGPIEHMLGVVVPGFAGRGHRPAPFAVELPGFFEYLEGERGQRRSPATAITYRGWGGSWRGLVSGGCRSSHRRS